MGFLRVAGITKNGKDGPVVNDLHFNQKPFENIGIAGETGSGKTTLLKIIGGLVQPDAGAVYFEEKRISGPMEQLIPGHPKIAYHSQYFELRNNYWVYELLEMAQKINSTEAETIYDVCAISHLLKRRTNELSGGEKQRIVLAMQLVKKPKLLLLDEPFSNLDAIHTRQMKEVIEAISRKLKISSILVSHDGADLLSWADKIFVMKDGNILQQGTPQQIYKQPIDAYCAGLFGDYTILSKELAQQFSIATDANIFIRPSAFAIDRKMKHTVEGIVQKAVYYGSYYLLQTKVGDELIKIQTDKLVMIGDTVFVSIKKEAGSQ